MKSGSQTSPQSRHPVPTRGRIGDTTRKRSTHESSHKSSVALSSAEQIYLGTERLAGPMWPTSSLWYSSIAINNSLLFPTRRVMKDEWRRDHRKEVRGGIALGQVAARVG